MNRRSFLSSGVAVGVGSVLLPSLLKDTAAFAQTNPYWSPVVTCDRQCGITIANLKTAIQQNAPQHRTAATIAAYKQAYLNWINDQNRIRSFSKFSTAMKTDPGGLITLPFQTQILSKALTEAASWGYQVPSLATVINALNQFRTGLTTANVVSEASQISTVFTGAGNIIATPDHSNDCHVFFWLGLFCALSGNEVGGIVCGIGMFMYC